jgi:hypothetical protein
MADERPAAQRMVIVATVDTLAGESLRLGPNTAIDPHTIWFLSNTGAAMAVAPSINALLLRQSPACGFA